MVNSIANNQIQGAGDLLQLYGTFDLLSLIMITFGFLALFYVAHKIGTSENKNCTGCKKVAQCQRDIKLIKEQLLLNEYVEPSALKDIIKKVEEIRKRILG